MPPGDTRPGRAAHANPYAVDVPTGVWSIFGLKEMTVEELNDELKTIKAEYERCDADIAYYKEKLKNNDHSFIYELIKENKEIESLWLSVYKKKIERLEWLIKHSKEEIARNSDLQDELKNLNAQLKSMTKYANDQLQSMNDNARLRDLEEKRLMTEARIKNQKNPPKRGLHAYFGNRYGNQDLDLPHMENNQNPLKQGLHTLFGNRYGNQKSPVIPLSRARRVNIP